MSTAIAGSFALCDATTVRSIAPPQLRPSTGPRAWWTRLRARRCPGRPAARGPARRAGRELGVAHGPAASDEARRPLLISDRHGLIDDQKALLDEVTLTQQHRVHLDLDVVEQAGGDRQLLARARPEPGQRQLPQLGAASALVSTTHRRRQRLLLGQDRDRGECDTTPHGGGPWLRTA